MKQVKNKNVVERYEPLVFEARCLQYFLWIWTEKSLVLCDSSTIKQKSTHREQKNESVKSSRRLKIVTPLPSKNREALVTVHPQDSLPLSFSFINNDNDNFVVVVVVVVEGNNVIQPEYRATKHQKIGLFFSTNFNQFEV
jgi:hypothetical protein